MNKRSHSHLPPDCQLNWQLPGGSMRHFILEKKQASRLQFFRFMLKSVPESTCQPNKKCFCNSELSSKTGVPLHLTPLLGATGSGQLGRTMCSLFKTFPQIHLNLRSCQQAFYISWTTSQFVVLYTKVHINICIFFATYVENSSEMYANGLDVLGWPTS